MLKKLVSNHLSQSTYLYLGAFALILLPWIVGASGGNYWVRVLDFALLYIVLALGLNVVVGFAGLLDLGYIAFYALGAYSYALLASPHLPQHFETIARHAFFSLDGGSAFHHLGRSLRDYFGAAHLAIARGLFGDRHFRFW